MRIKIKLRVLFDFKFLHNSMYLKKTSVVCMLNDHGRRNNIVLVFVFL
jgi:hypothetical protein